MGDRMTIAGIIRSLTCGALVAASGVAAAQVMQQEASGTIVLYRPSSIIGAGVACPFRYEGKDIVELGRSKYAEWKVPPGEYVITNKISSVDVHVAPGQTRYVRCKVKVGIIAGSSDLQIVDRASFEEHAADYERKEITFVLPPKP